MKKKWYEDLDFAWIGKDINGNVGIFFIKPSICPSEILSFYTEDTYNEITVFIMDELEHDREIISYMEKVWSPDDARKGLFVFDYNSDTNKYEKVAAPKEAIGIEVFKENKVDEFIINVDIDFRVCNQVSSEIKG